MIDQPNNEAAPSFGRIAPQDALTAIRAENKRVGLTVSDPDEFVMAHELAKAVRHDMAKNRTFIVDGAGNARTKMQDGALVDLTVADLIAMLQTTATPTSRTTTLPVPVTAGGSNRTERAVAAKAALRSTDADTKAAMAVDLVSRFGNPWSTGNKTHQAFVTNTNPTLASQLKPKVRH